jgi:hypothetical protein
VEGNHKQITLVLHVEGWLRINTFAVKKKTVTEASRIIQNQLVLGEESKVSLKGER